MSKSNKKNTSTEVTAIHNEKQENIGLKERVAELEKENNFLNGRLQQMQVLIEKLKNIIVKKELVSLDGAVVSKQQEIKKKID